MSSSKPDESALVTEVVEGVRARVKDAHRSGRLDWELVPKEERLKPDQEEWRPTKGGICFYFRTTFSEDEAHIRIQEECHTHTELKNVSSVTVEERRIIIVFSTSI